MKQILPTFAWVLAVAVVNGPLAASSTSSKGDTEQVVAFERAWAKAAVDGDVRAMATFMADDYVEIVMDTALDSKKSSWVTTSKPEWLALLQSGREKYESVELRNLKVYFHADIATVTGEYTQTSVKDGKQTTWTGVYVDTWVKKSGNWQVVSSVFP